MTVPSPIIHVVDDDPSFRKGLARLLKASGYQVAVYESGNQLLQNPPSGDPGCIVLDMRMSGMSGLEVQEHLSKLDSILPIVFLTGHGDIPTSVKAIKGGAEDFLTKPVSKTRLLQCVERALERYARRREQYDRLSTLRHLVSALTPRESAVFAGVIRGKLNKQIAYDLGTAERTVKAHRQSIMKKLNVRSAAEAVSIAEKLGMLSAPVDGPDAKMPNDHPPAEVVDCTKGQ